MLNQDIHELLSHVKNEISSISIQSNEGTINKIALKNTLENLRSILDYAAQDIRGKLKTENKAKVYFPYGQRKNHFLKSVVDNLPNLQQSIPSIYALVESIQPFVSSDAWLVDLCGLTNDVKHNKLSETDNQKSKTVYQGGSRLGTFGTGCDVTMRGNTVNGVLQDEVHIATDGTILILPISGQTFIVENNKIEFRGKKIEVPAFLNKCYKNISVFVEQLYIELASL